MARTERRVQDHRSLWVSLIVAGMMVGATMTSCGGGGGGGSSGALCSQCGDTDGPCISPITIVPGEGQPQCTSAVDPVTGSCTVDLVCRRKSDSSQQRCFPKDPSTGDVDYFFRCDGSRPGGTAVPQPTNTPTPVTSPNPQPTSCGDGVLQGDEECDAFTFQPGDSCEARDCGTGVLSCTNDCQVSVFGCSNNSSGLCDRD